jgi:hypothetical protein
MIHEMQVLRITALWVGNLRQTIGSTLSHDHEASLPASNVEANA